MDGEHKFSRRFLVLRREDLKKHIYIISSPNYLNYRDVIEDYLRILRKRYPDNIFALNNLQIHILQDIAAAERTITDYKNHIKALDKEKQKADIEYFNNEINLNHLFRNKLKDIGDALAWKYFNYDRSKIYVFSDHPEVGFLQQEGLFSEIGVWLRQYYSEGNFPILNSITNCLRVGDVLSKDKSGNIQVYEVKSSKRGGRSRKMKQLKTMDELVELLNNRSLLEGKIEKRIIPISIFPQNYFKKIHTLISQAYSRGYGVVELNDFSFVSIFNYELVKDFGKIKPELDKKFKEYMKSWDNRVHLLHNFMRYDFSAIIAPYSIFPFKENICTDLMFGKLAMTFNLNFTEFEKYLSRKGLEIIETPEQIRSNNPELAKQYVYCLGKGSFNMRIPSMSLNTMFFEFRHPNTFVKEFLAIRDNLKYGETPYVLFVNEQEHKIWR